MEEKIRRSAFVELRMQMHLGAQFKKLFAETASQPIPERFTDLLDRLEASEAPRHSALWSRQEATR